MRSRSHFTGFSPPTAADYVSRPANAFILLLDVLVDVPQQDLTEAFDLGLCKQMLESRTTFSRYFEGIHEDKQQGRSRLLLSEELKTMYPEDEKVSEMWVARDLP